MNITIFDNTYCFTDDIKIDDLASYKNELYVAVKLNITLIDSETYLNTTVKLFKNDPIQKSKKQ